MVKLLKTKTKEKFLYATSEENTLHRETMMQIIADFSSKAQCSRWNSIFEVLQDTAVDLEFYNQQQCSLIVEKS